MRGRYQKPDGERVRRNAVIATTKLPAEGRKGRSPEWPLEPDIVTLAKLRAAQAKVEDLEYKAEDGKPVDAALQRAREKVIVLEHVNEIQAAAEKTLWKRLWHMPQAVMWEREQAHREVALYVRWSILAENGDIKAAAEARQRSDRLGLTPQAMMRLRWSIAPNEVEEKRAENTTPASTGRRLRAVDTSAVAGP